MAYARGRGVVLVAPAGDDGTGGGGIVNYPAAYRGVISVGAFDKSFTKAPFSSHQSYVTMTAAGAGVAAETPSGYTTVSSTAAASAVVAGIVALIRSAFPALTPCAGHEGTGQQHQVPAAEWPADRVGLRHRGRGRARCGRPPRWPSRDGQRAYTGSAGPGGAGDPGRAWQPAGLRAELERDASSRPAC